MTLGVIIVAAGKSQRMGFDKLTHPLGDSFVLQHSVSKFCNCGNVAQVCIATDQKRFSQLQPHDKIFRVDGGTERQNSVANGIEKLSNCDFIAVHDGARPLISSIQIQKS